MINQVRLLDVCDFQGGTQPPKNEWISEPQEGYVRMLQIRDYSQGAEKFIEYVKDTGKLHMCSEDDIMLSRYGYIGQAFTGLAGAYNVALVKVIKKREIDTKYLFYYFQSAYFQHSLLSSVGSRATIPGFNKSELENTLIPIPNINEQEKIGTVLNKLDEILELHQAQITKLDELVKARFVELFGTLENPVQEFKKATLKELCNKITDGKHGGCTQEEGTERYFVGAREIYDDEVHYDTAPEINVVEFEKDYKRCNIEIGDFLIVNTGATIGKSAIATDLRTKHTLLQKSVALLKVKQKLLNPVFLKWCYRVNTKMYMVESASAQPNLLLSKINATEIYVPDIELQNQFTTFVEQTDKSKLAIQQSLDKLETLKKALMQKYFG